MGAPPQIVVVCEIREDFELPRRTRAAALLQPAHRTMEATMATPTPRLLHYMFLSLVPPGAPPRPAKLSRAYDYWLRSCVRANPAYRIVLWTRDDCDRLIATRHPKSDRPDTARGACAASSSRTKCSRTWLNA